MKGLKEMKGMKGMKDLNPETSPHMKKREEVKRKKKEMGIKMMKM